METALKTLNFGPEALWITLGTLVAMAALVLLALQLVSHIGSSHSSLPPVFY